MKYSNILNPHSFTVILIAILLFSISSCEVEDELIIVTVSELDYDLKTFSADYNYQDGTYYNQVYFSFTDSIIDTATYDTDEWTQFNLVANSDEYNDTSSVLGWDLLFTNYTANLGTEESPYAYKVTGVLINITNNVEVGTMEYTEYTESDSITAAFVNLSLSDIDTITYSSDCDAIGYNWKTYTHSSGIYTLNKNYFYFVKIDEETIYKLHFISFYGSSTDDRVAKIQYQLMQ